jgi:hypothetical protein
MESCSTCLTDEGSLINSGVSARFVALYDLRYSFRAPKGARSWVGKAP